MNKTLKALNGMVLTRKDIKEWLDDIVNEIQFVIKYIYCNLDDIIKNQESIIEERRKNGLDYSRMLLINDFTKIRSENLKKEYELFESIYQELNSIKDNYDNYDDLEYIYFLLMQLNEIFKLPITEIEERKLHEINGVYPF